MYKISHLFGVSISSVYNIIKEYNKNGIKSIRESIKDIYFNSK